MKDRFMFWGPYARHWYPHFWYGGDEYGNPSIVFSWFISIIFFYNRAFQQDVEMPNAGENAWVDHVFFGGGVQE